MFTQSKNLGEGVQYLNVWCGDAIGDLAKVCHGRPSALATVVQISWRWKGVGGKGASPQSEANIIRLKRHHKLDHHRKLHQGRSDSDARTKATRSRLVFANLRLFDPWTMRPADQDKDQERDQGAKGPKDQDQWPSGPNKGRKGPGPYSG